MALHNYESTFQLLPPAVIHQGRGEPLGPGIFPYGTIDHVWLGESSSSDRIQMNWLGLLLPHLEQANLQQSRNSEFALSAAENERFRRASPPVFLCPSDGQNTISYSRGAPSGDLTQIYGRGNYAMNMGTNDICLETHRDCPNGFIVDHADLTLQSSTLVGNGVGGFNFSRKFSDFQQGLSNIVAVDEVRAGVDTADPRGVWSLGMLGSSITTTHRVGPNSSNGDGVTGCTQLVLEFSEERLSQLGMPCFSAPIPASVAAAVRSQHRGLVNVLFLDGSVQRFSNQVDLDVWAKKHGGVPPEISY